jgi:peptidoglycan/LPS O-acetylase OafA/YrhL
MGSKKFLAVEGIRGVACLMVVLSHYSLAFFPYLHSFDDKAPDGNFQIQSYIHESPLGFFYSGTSAVFIFFVLSGFILTEITKQASNRKLIETCLKRYPRLMLPALCSCLFAFCLYKMAQPSSEYLTSWVNGFGNMELTLFGALYNGTVDVFFLSGKSDFNPVLWTMKIELLGSFLIYFLCFNYSRNLVPFLSLGAFFLIVFLTKFRLIELELGFGLAAFIIGYAFSRKGVEVSFSVSISLLFVGLYFAGAHNSSWSYTGLYSLLGDYTYYYCNFVSGFFIVYAILFNKKINVLFSSRAMENLGRLSFSIYLVHLPLLGIIGVASFNIFYSYIGSYILSAIVASVTSIFITYIVSEVFYEYVDKKGLRFSAALSNLVLSYYSTSKNIKKEDV